MRTLSRVSLALIIVGAINWGLIGIFNFDLVATIFGGSTATITRIVYALVGISALFFIADYSILSTDTHEHRY